MTEITHWPRIVLLWLCGVLAAMQFAKISVAFLDLQALYGVTPVKMGLILSTVGMVGLVFGVTVGLFAPAIGYRRLLLAGLGLGALMSLLQSLVLPYPALFATRVLEGGSQLAVVVAAPTLIVASCAPGHKSIAMGLWSTFVGVAFAVTAALGSSMINRWGVGGFLLLHAAGMVVVGVAAALVLKADADTLQRPKWPRLASLLAQHVHTYTHFATALPGLCFFCYTVVGVALLTFVPQYAGRDKAWLAVVLPLTITAGTFCAGWLAQHWVSPLRLARGAFCCVGLSGVALWLSTRMGFSIAPAALLLLFTSGLSGGSGYALIPYMSDESLVQARANGAVAQMGNLGSTIGPPLFAAFSTALGMAGLVLPVVAFSSLGLLLAAWAARAHAQPQPRTTKTG